MSAINRPCAGNMYTCMCMRKLRISVRLAREVDHEIPRNRHLRNGPPQAPPARFLPLATARCPLSHSNRAAEGGENICKCAIISEVTLGRRIPGQFWAQHPCPPNPEILGTKLPEISFPKKNRRIIISACLHILSTVDKPKSEEFIIMRPL